MYQYEKHEDDSTRGVQPMLKHVTVECSDTHLRLSFQRWMYSVRTILMLDDESFVQRSKCLPLDAWLPRLACTSQHVDNINSDVEYDAAACGCVH
jgi:hypothetical protein